MPVSEYASGLCSRGFRVRSIVCSNVRAVTGWKPPWHALRSTVKLRDAPCAA